MNEILCKIKGTSEFLLLQMIIIAIEEIIRIKLCHDKGLKIM